MKKCLSLIIALLMLGSVFTLTAAAAEPDAASAPTDTAEQETVSPPAADEENTVGVPEADYPVITDFQNLGSGVKISWDNYKDEKIYRVYYRKAKSCFGTWEEKYGGTEWTRLATVRGNSYVHTAVSDAEVGIYTLRCVDEAGSFTSAFNPDGRENCWYAAPEITSIRFDEDGVRLSWEPSWQKHGERADECYRVYRRTEGKSWTRIADGLTDGAYFDDTAVKGTVYLYTVRMVTEDGSRFLSDYLSGKSVSFTGYPLITAIENTDGGVNLSWQKYSGAAKYRVYYRSSGGWTRIAQVSGTGYLDSSVKNGESRVYTLRALDSRGEFISDFNHAGWESTYFSAPLIQSIANTTEGVKLTWNRTPSAEDYRVYRKTTGSWTRLAQTDQGEYTDTAAVSGTKYTYTIRMVTRDGERFMSDYLSGKSITYVAAPVITETTNLSDGVRISWNKVPGANFYRIYYRSENGWTRLASKYLTEYVDKSVEDGQTREYTVRCLDANENFISDFYREGAVNTFYAPPEISDLTVTGSGVTLSWNRAPGAEDYRVYRRFGSEGWTRLAQTDKSSFTDTDAETGVRVTYTIRMVTADGTRFMSSYTDGKSITPCDKPVITSTSLSEDGVVLRWEPVENAALYRIYYKTGSSWTRLSTVAGTTCTDAGIAHGETRTYTVRCLDANGLFCSDYDRTGWSRSFCAAPAVTSVDNILGVNYVRWSPLPGVSAYRLYRQTFGEEEAIPVKDNITDCVFSDAAIVPDGIYSYYLISLDENGSPVSGTPSQHPYYQNGVPAEGELTVNGTVCRFVGGSPFSGYYPENGRQIYYRDGVRVTSGWYNSSNNQAKLSASQWLYALMSATDDLSAVDPADAQAIFDLAAAKGVITSATDKSLTQPVTRRFVAQTMTRALHYEKRSAVTLSDLSASDGDLTTLAYYGYFLPDAKNRISPAAVVTPAEFNKLLSELELYRRLNGKTVMTFGDSIMYGAGNNHQGVGEMIAEKYGMFCRDYSVKGSTMGTAIGRRHIPDQVRQALADRQPADIILINGGTNDMVYTELGKLTKGTDLSGADESTFTGGFETAMQMIRTNWSDTPVIYIRSHRMTFGTDENERLFGERGITIAVKWNAAAIDLYNDSTMNTEIQSVCDRYSYQNPSRGNLSDSIHPNALGYAAFYLPPVSERIAATLEK